MPKIRHKQLNIRNLGFTPTPKSKGWGVSSVKAELGFTLIELMVVLAIMTVVLGLVIIDFSRQRPVRDMQIAQNELVTNIRKVQSYSLFSRNVGNLKPAQYYLVKFSSATPDRYFIQAITDVSVAPKLNLMETVMLPRNVIFASSNPFVIDRPTPIIDPATPPSCVLLAFKSPYGKTYVNDGCTQNNFQTGDDYKKIIDHISNINNESVTVDTDLVINFAFKNGGSGRKVIVKGVIGLVCPTVDGTTCSF